MNFDILQDLECPTLLQHSLFYNWKHQSKRTNLDPRATAQVYKDIYHSKPFDLCGTVKLWEAQIRSATSFAQVC